MTRTNHTPTDECYETHCHAHGVDEPAAGAYLVCGECGHAYPSARALRRDYRREYWRVSGDDRFDHLPLWRRVWRVLTVRASRVYFCQHCLHDFVWPAPASRWRRWLRRDGGAA